MHPVRGRSQLFETITRVALLLFWALVLWGALTFASTLANAWGEGPAAAIERLVPARGTSIWGWLSPVSMLLALATALGIGALAIWNRTIAAQQRSE